MLEAEAPILACRVDFRHVQGFMQKASGKRLLHALASVIVLFSSPFYYSAEAGPMSTAHA